MFEKNHGTKKKNLRFTRLRRRFFLFIKRHFFWLILGLVGLWVAGSFFVAPIARSKLSELCNSAVYVKSGRLKGFNGIRLKGVVIAEDTDTLVHDPIVQCDEFEIRFDPWKLLRGKFEINSIVFDGFLLNADYDTGADRWNFQNLFFQSSTKGGKGKIPLVNLRRGVLRIRQRKKNEKPETITQISLNGQAAVQSGVNQYNFSLATDGRFGYGDSTLQGTLKIGQPGEKSHFSAEGEIRMPQTRVFENAWNLENIQFECQFDRRGVMLKRCGFSMGQAQVAIQGAIQRGAENQRGLNLDVSLRDLRLSDHYEKDAVVYSEPVLELLDPGLRRFLTRYHPSGTGDIELSIKGHLEDLEATQVDGAIICRDVSIQDDKFPYLLEHMRGNIELSGRDLKFDQLTAKHNDVDLQINGSVRNIGPKAEIDLRTTSSNMQFDIDLWKALDERVKRIWSSFTPRGMTKIDYHFRRFPDASKDMTLQLELTDADLIYERFPYPLEHLTGTVIMEPDGVQIKELVSHYDDERKITLNGQVLQTSRRRPQYRIHVQAERIPVDELLINAMPPEQRGFFDKLEVNAVANLDVDVFPNVTGKRPVDYIAKVQLDGDYLLYQGFPLEMEQVHLKADVTQDVVLLREFNGHTSGGQVVMSGTLLPKGIDSKRPGLCLELKLDDFDLNERFWDVAGKDADRILGKLRLQGKADIHGHLVMNLSTKSCASTDLVIRCAQNPVTWDANELGFADGSFHLKGNSVSFEDFSLNDILLETVPKALLHSRLKAMYDGIKPQGKVDIKVDRGVAEVGQNGLDRMDVSGSVTFRDVAGGQTGVMANIDGIIHGSLGIDRDKNTWRTAADYELDRVKYRDWMISDLQGKYFYDPNTMFLRITDFSGDLYGGKIAGSIKVDLSNEKQTPYSLGLSIRDVEVGKLLAGERSDAPDQVTEGLAFGALNVEGTLQSTLDSHGKVNAHVVNMKLGKQSVTGRILTAMQFKRPDEFVFSEVEFTALVRGRELIIEDVRMAGKPLVFRGKGKLDWEQKQIQMDLVAFDRLLGKEDTILDLLARGFGAAIWKVEIRGDINQPQVDAVYLSVLKQPLDLFKKEE